jgi:hypothetical protein
MFIILAIPSVTSWIVHESGSRRSVGRPLRGGAAAEPGTGLGQRLDDALVDLWDLSVRDQDWITGDEPAPLRSSALRPPLKMAGQGMQFAGGCEKPRRTKSGKLTDLRTEAP